MGKTRESHQKMPFKLQAHQSFKSQHTEKLDIIDKWLPQNDVSFSIFTNCFLFLLFRDERKVGKKRLKIMKIDSLFNPKVNSKGLSSW